MKQVLNIPQKQQKNRNNTTQDETIHFKAKIDKLEAENKSLKGNIVDMGNKLR